MPRMTPAARTRRRLIMAAIAGVVLCAVLLALSSCSPVTPVAVQKPVWLVVTRPMFVEALDPLVEHRRSQGYEAVVSTESPSDALQHLGRAPASILLVGDHHDFALDEPWCVPTFRLASSYYYPNRVPLYSCDLLFGDLDGDGTPDVPVGRIPVRTAEELAAVVEKIVWYETRPPTLDDLRLPVWAGKPDYGAQIDNMVAAFLLSTLAARAHGWEEFWVLTADEQHPLSCKPQDEARVFVEQLQRGGALVAMMGHGLDHFFQSRRSIAQLSVEPPRGHGFSTYMAETLLSQGRPAPPLFIFACYCGNFSSARPSLAETFLKQPGGPVAVVAATDRSHPLMNYYSGVCLLEATGDGTKRLGDLWLDVQRSALKQRNAMLERLTISLDKDVAVPSDLDEIRRTHVLMYAVLGDPAMPLRLPERLEVTVERSRGSRGWHWRAEKPLGATALHVGLRPPLGPFERSSKRLTRQQALDRLARANGRFVFSTLEQLDVDQPWEGVVTGEGTLRFVAMSDKALYVATVELKAESTSVSDDARRRGPRIAACRRSHPAPYRAASGPEAR